MAPHLLKYMNDIVGFSIQITAIQAAYKLSQNRTEKDYHQIIQKLEDKCPDVAHEMKKIK